ncbi:hypothetical protein P153DRAFT_220474 [Dothidotthia symphoricarpi CBS 119687]|uniref:Secreted protein n=1 Tax=Dothidotthia symphoricarpi CBS 119687 TaxID=1392245 RepID=A0A6A6AI10_9PLEO|nr:uncharacterized protein P153DRAFT_220474 [Dothidotthia symphoricarpi CBS 119687]KAF2130547.1 hypothetical protein P153DRAFT_220474 [Dothidotthia symphoricarpi CBS 119687]
MTLTVVRVFLGGWSVLTNSLCFINAGPMRQAGKSVMQSARRCVTETKTTYRGRVRVDVGLINWPNRESHLETYLAPLVPRAFPSVPMLSVGFASTSCHYCQNCQHPVH